jgi:hypothetical protein
VAWHRRWAGSNCVPEVGNMLKEFIDKAPELIEQASRNPLALAALIVIVLGLVAALTRNPLALAALVVIVLGLVVVYLFIAETGIMKLLAVLILAVFACLVVFAVPLPPIRGYTGFVPVPEPDPDKTNPKKTAL